ncbi:MAG TPA: ABC transporter permease [Longimicrobiaceae bacterium]|nr:ABC transporter permease [Longimicrobiaceae bacterium]
MDRLLGNIRYAFRTLAHSPGFTLVAVLTLALGIGANTAIFSVVNAVLLRPLPFAEPDRLVTVAHLYPSLNNLEAGVGAPTYRDLQGQPQLFSSVSVQGGWGVNLTGQGQAQRLTGSLVSPEFFETYGVPAALGRTLQPPAPGTAARENEVVLSHGTWQRVFGGDPGVVGRTVQINGEAYEIVGVMPQSFRSALDPNVEIWAPFVFTPGQLSDGARASEYLALTARLKPGVSVETAERAMAAWAERIKREYPSVYPPDWTLRLRSLTEQLSGSIRPALLVLLGAVGFVLLIACGNVANLLLARAAARRTEVAIRSALGARSGDLVRQFLVESLVLSTAGALLGLALAFWGLQLLATLRPPNLLWVETIPIDASVLAFTSALVLLTAVAFGIVPMMQVRHANVQSTLREGGRSGGPDRRGAATRRVLVVAQVALSLMLLTGAGLLMRSFARLQQVDPGFDPRGVVTMNIALPEAKYPNDTAWINFFDALLPRVAALPGVQSAGAASSVPLTGGWNRSFTVEGITVPEGETGPYGNFRTVYPDFHRTLRIPLRRGRFFTDADRRGAPRVAIVDELMAERYWPGQDPIGKRISLDATDAGPNWVEVVGVVGHTRQDGLESEGRAQLYVPFRQYGIPTLTLAVRTAGDPTQLAGAVRATVQELDPEQPIERVQTMEQLVSATLGPRRFSMVLLGLFGAVALVLAAVGIYGVMSFDVARRSQEIGVRMALGAQAGEVLRLVLRQGLRLVAVGVVLGMLGSLAVANLIRSQLYEMSAVDPVTFALVVVVLLGAAALALLVPARRATHVDPLSAMRAG